MNFQENQRVFGNHNLFNFKRLGYTDIPDTEGYFQVNSQRAAVLKDIPQEYLATQRQLISDNRASLFNNTTKVDDVNLIASDTVMTHVQAYADGLDKILPQMSRNEFVECNPSSIKNLSFLQPRNIACLTTVYVAVFVLVCLL